MKHEWKYIGLEAYPNRPWDQITFEHCLNCGGIRIIYQKFKATFEQAKSSILAREVEKEKIKYNYSKKGKCK